MLITSIFILYFILFGDSFQICSRAPLRLYNDWDDQSLGENSAVYDDRESTSIQTLKKLVFVGNLPFTFEGDDLQALAQTNGINEGLLSCRIPVNFKTKRSRGFGFLEYSTVNQAEIAVQKLSGLEIEGRQLKVDLDEGVDGPNKGRRAPETSKDFSIFVGNLDYSLSESDVEEIFRTELSRGEINIETGEDEKSKTDGNHHIRIPIRSRIGTIEGRSKGFGHVDFSDEETVVRALQLNGQLEIMGRLLTIERANGIKKSGSLGGASINFLSSSSPNRFDPPPSPKVLTKRPQEQYSVFIGNLPFQVSAEDIKTMTDDLIGLGIVKKIRIAIDRETGQSKGFCHVDFSSAEEVSKAVSELNGIEMYGRLLRVDVAAAKDLTSGYSEVGPGRGAGGRGGRFGSRDRGGFGGRGGRGRSGGRDRPPRIDQNW